MNNFEENDTYVYTYTSSNGLENLLICGKCINGCNHM